MTIRSFSERVQQAQIAEARQSLTPTEHLLALILVELMNTRARRGLAEVAKALKGAGLSPLQVAAILGTTPATLAVAKARDKETDD